MMVLIFLIWMKNLPFYPQRDEEDHLQLQTKQHQLHHQVNQRELQRKGPERNWKTILKKVKKKDLNMILWEMETKKYTMEKERESSSKKVQESEISACKESQSGQRRSTNGIK